MEPVSPPGVLDDPSGPGLVPQVQEASAEEGQVGHDDLRRGEQRVKLQHALSWLLLAPRPYLLIGDGVGHVGRVDHGWNAAQERNGAVEQLEVALLIFQKFFKRRIWNCKGDKCSDLFRSTSVLVLVLF